LSSLKKLNIKTVGHRAAERSRSEANRAERIVVGRSSMETGNISSSSMRKFPRNIKSQFLEKAQKRTVLRGAKNMK